MAKHDWLPKIWSDWGDEDNPFGALRRQIDSVMEDFDKGGMLQRGEFALRTNVSETDAEICMTAELPGLDTDDVEVEISGDTIMISGEKKSEKDEKSEEEGRHFHRIERRSGAFRRMTRLPFEIDPDSVRAEVKNGVLTVTVPKPAEVQKPARKVEIKQAG